MHINTIYLSYIIQQVSVVSLKITRLSYKNTIYKQLHKMYDENHPML